MAKSRFQTRMCVNHPDRVAIRVVGSMGFCSIPECRNQSFTAQFGNKRNGNVGLFLSQYDQDEETRKLLSQSYD